MSFRALVIALLLMASQLQAYDQPQNEKALNDKYAGKVLTIRGFYKQNHLAYDSSGEPKFKGNSVPWTLYGKLEITGLKVKKGKLEIEGTRLWVEWVPASQGERQMQLVRTTEGVSLRADLTQQEPQESEIDNILGRIFVSPKDAMSELVPEHWRKFFGGTGCTFAPSSEFKAQPGQRGLSVGRLMKHVNPVYPDSAKRARLQGPVILEAVIDKQGRLRCLSVLQPLGLGTEEAAVDAAKQWTYQPYLINGEPVEVETKITVNYQLTN
jgi:TonB family protein